MAFEPLPLPFAPEAVPGLSERLLRSHHANNYGGAVKRLQAIRAQLQKIARSQVPPFELNGLKREELIATNSMLLHELYFDCISPDEQAMEPAWNLALEASFGSVERWREEFIACASALRGGSGWVLLSFLPREGALVNQWASDHAHAIAAAVPILALDMYEHAYHLDYGADASAYIEAFMKAIAWKSVYARYQAAIHAASESFACAHDQATGAMLVDVRRAGVFQQASQIAEGASWRDPGKVSEWAQEFKGKPVVVYCVHGHEVSRATVMRLRALGVEAKFLVGGFEGWKASGLPTETK